MEHVALPAKRITQQEDAEISILKTQISKLSGLKAERQELIAGGTLPVYRSSSIFSFSFSSFTIGYFSIIF